MTSRELPRHYQVWDAYDYRTVVAGCLEKLSDENIARKVGRTAAAVRDRGEYFVDLEPGQTGVGLSRLREELAVNPEYDWEAAVRRRHAADQLPYWDEAGDALLRQAWEQSASGLRASRWKLVRGKDRTVLRMAQLEERLGIHEFEIYRRLRHLNLSTDIVEVVARLGASEHGSLAAKARIQYDRTSTTVYLLVVTDESGGVLHASVHASEQAALEAKDAAAGGFVSTPLAVWTICGRGVGDGIIGTKTVTGSFEPVAPVVDLDALGYGA